MKVHEKGQAFSVIIRTVMHGEVFLLVNVANILELERETFHITHII